MKKIKIKLSSMLIAIVFAVVALIACNPGSSTGDGPFTPPIEEDPHVTELSIVTPPTKTAYKAFDLFDPAGMKLLAKWSHGVEEDIRPNECKRSPNGPLEVGTTEITFTYEGASCSQAITVTNRSIVDVTFDCSPLQYDQVAGAVDLTVIVVKAKYDDGSDETLTSDQYVLSENGKAITNPRAYVASPGQHTISVRYGDHSEEFTFFAALDGFTVPITVYGADDFDRLIAEGKSFLYKPDPSYAYNHGGFENGESMIYNIFGGAVMRFYVYMEKQSVVELKVRAASSQLLSNSWDDVREMGEEQFNKVFDVSKVKVNVETGELEPGGGNEIKTAMPIDDYVILPGGKSEIHDPALKGNYVNLSIGEIALEAGYNLIEFDCISEYTDLSGIKRGCQFVSLTVQTAFTEEHTHDPVKTDATSPDCIHYGTEQYYTCKICGRMFADEGCTERLLAYKYVRPTAAHTPDIQQATCIAEQKCSVCGKILAAKAPHTFEQDLCSYDGMAECSVCHESFKGGHILRNVTESGVTRTECVQCNKTLGIKIQAEDAAHVSYRDKNGGSIDMTWCTSRTTNVPNDVNDLSAGTHEIFNGTDGSCLWDLNSDHGWQGGYMEISVHAEEAGVYTFAARTQYGGNTNNGSESHDLTNILSYCVNPDSERVFTAVSGKAPPASRGINWSQLYLWGTTVFADVTLNAGDNTVILKIADTDGVRACQIDSFIFEKKDEIKHPDAEIISFDAATQLYDAGARSYGTDSTTFVDDGILCINGRPVYMRIKLADETAAQQGWAYEDIVITQDMLTAANFTTAVGEHSIELTAEKYGKSYAATFEYTIA